MQSAKLSKDWHEGVAGFKTEAPSDGEAVGRGQGRRRRSASCDYETAGTDQGDGNNQGSAIK